MAWLVELVECIQWRAPFIIWVKQHLGFQATANRVLQVVQKLL